MLSSQIYTYAITLHVKKYDFQYYFLLKKNWLSETTSLIFYIFLILKHIHCYSNRISAKVHNRNTYLLFFWNRWDTELNIVVVIEVVEKIFQHCNRSFGYLYSIFF